MSEFDIFLNRSIKPGKEFDKLMPKTNCKSVYLGKGMTDFSIVKMEEWVKKYAWQTEKVAAVLQSGSLEDNVSSIKDFAYNHFQYKADNDDQMLRSPACSWYDRENGIDCKSYSIIASCLLLNMGITHYIRKIKQAAYEPTAWTHVYVVVPKDQKSGSLEKGYYVIDGTIEEDDEPPFTEKSDLLMLNHYGLNGNYNGLKASIYGFDIKNLGDIGSALSHALCGSSALNDDDLKTTLTNIQKYFDAIVLRMNNAVTQGDTEGFADAVCEFYGASKLYVDAVNRNRDANDWNSCTDGRVAILLHAYAFYRDVVGVKALTSWLNQYFDKVPGQGTMPFTNQGAEAKYGFRFTNTNPWKVVNEPRFMYYTKPSVSQIKAFELNHYIQEQGTKAPNFNPAEFLQSLSHVVATFDNHNSDDDHPMDNPDSDNLDNNISTSTQKAGMGTFIGLALLTAGIAYAFSNSRNKGKGAIKST